MKCEKGEGGTRVIIILLPTSTLMASRELWFNVTFWLLGESIAKGRMAGEKMCGDGERYFT